MIRLFLILVPALLLASCAKNIAREKVRDGDRQNIIQKQGFLGQPAESVKQNFVGSAATSNIFLAKTTIVETSNSPGGIGFLGFQGDVKIGYFDFTENQMQFKSLAGLKGGVENVQIKNPVLLSWNINHFDFTLNETDGQTTNQEILDNFKEWNERKYFRINWAFSPNMNNLANMMPSTAFAQFQCWEPMSQEQVPGSMKIEDDHIGFKLKVVYQRNPACGSPTQWSQGDFNFTTTYMFSFRKAEKSDYQPKIYTEEQDPTRYKYGHFQTVRQVLDKEDGTPVNRFMENRWAEKTQTFYYIKGFPEKYKWIWDHTKPHSVFGQTNALLKSAGSKLRFEIYDYNHNPKTGSSDGPEREFGDLRYSFINFIEDLESGGTPLGYGPSDTHPWTGEIIAANSMVWTGLLDWFVKRSQLVADKAQDESSLYSHMLTALKASDFGDFEKNWDHTQGVGKLFKEMAQETRYVFPGWNPYTSEPAQSVVTVATVLDKHPGFKEGLGSSGLGISQRITQVENIATLGQETLPYPLVEQLGPKNSTPLVFTNPYGNAGFGRYLRTSATAGINGSSFDGGERPRNLMLALKELLEDPEFNFSHFAGPNKSGSDGFDKLFENFARDNAIENRMNQQGHCIMDIHEFGSGLASYLKAAKLDLNENQQAREDFINTVLYRVSIHEFGHNLNLRHNFYGSVDQSNFNLHQGDQLWSNNLKVLSSDGKVKKGKRVQVSSSVMDYIRLEDEINTPWAWEDYDVAAILDSYKPQGFDDKGNLFLFCTDEHTATSAICNRHDLGTTPSQVMMSQIRAYEEGYVTRNFRFGRAFWNTRSYSSRILGTMLSMKEFLPMWRSAFAGDLIIQKLEETGVTNLNEQKGLVEEMNQEMLKVMKLSLAFYQGVIQQSAGTRGFRSDYDPVTGALTRIGIFFDKLFATHMMANDFPIFYNPNRVMSYNSYLTYASQPELAEFTDQLWRNLITNRNIAMEPWFTGFARRLYAQNATNFANREISPLIDLIKIVKVDNANDLDLHYGIDFNPDIEGQAKRVIISKTKGPTFRKGEEVVVVHINGEYFMTPVAESGVAYSLFQEAFDRIGRPGADEESIAQFNYDVLELHWLYSRALQGGL